MNTLKGLFYFYQRAFYYIGNAKNELLKPLGLWNETLLVLTYLAVSGTKPTIPEIVFAYFFVLGTLLVIGKIVIVLGITKYNNRINNHQNEEFMLLHKKVDEVLELLHGRK